MSTEPPEYVEIPTLYDDTHRGRWTYAPDIASVGNKPNLTGFLEHHDPATDGSFSIWFGLLTDLIGQQALYESIPEAYRPPLDMNDADVAVTFSARGEPPRKATGSIIMPVILDNAETNTQFRIKLYSLVVPGLQTGMFIGSQTAQPYLREVEDLPLGGYLWGFEFMRGEATIVDYLG
ncbi:unnamed protein product [Cyclocybe aegerita]|uniref:Uncharacterized protein n=1 Tax=Cyclocybe aegerita TaxID=1973307 RepID=A0A8S0VZQ4_CYCAE|nr:unnamed protein product [Cyclocybe aegerita]